MHRGFTPTLDLGAHSRVYRPAMSLKVSELADKAGVSTDTVRYYEKEELLAEPERTQSGYRQYDEGAVERLHFIPGAQTLGLKLGDIKELLAIRDRGACPCGHTQQHSKNGWPRLMPRSVNSRPLSGSFNRWSSCNAPPIRVHLRGLARSSL